MKSFGAVSVFVLLAAGLIAVTALMPRPAAGQSPSKDKADYRNKANYTKRPDNVPVTEPPVAIQYSEFSPYVGRVDQQFYAFRDESAQLAQKYAKAENDDEKATIRKSLTQVLEKQFDAQLKAQQQELEDLEKQVAKLKKLLSRRKEAKETIVERRLEQLVQEAEGLGWNVPNAPRTGQNWFSAPSPLWGKDSRVPASEKAKEFLAK